MKDWQQVLPKFGLALIFVSAPLFAGIAGFVKVVRNSDPGVEGLNGAAHVVTSSGQPNVFVASTDDDALVILSWDASRESLAFRQALFDGRDGVFGLDEPSAISATPNGNSVFVTSQIDDSLALFTRDASLDIYALRDLEQNGVSGVAGLDGASTTIHHPLLPVVYTGAQISSAVSVFSHDASGDQLAFLETHENGRSGVRGLGDVTALALSPDSGYLYAASPEEDTIAVFRVGRHSGRLTYEQDFSTHTPYGALEEVSALHISGDGRHLYATGSTDRIVLAFERLTYAGLSPRFAAELPTTGGSLVKSIVGSQDGDLIAIVTGPGAFSLFRRTAGTGALELLKTYADGDDSIDDLAGVRGLAFLGDGTFLVAAAATDDAVSAIDVGIVFRDGFETGSPNRWSMTKP